MSGNRRACQTTDFSGKLHGHLCIATFTPLINLEITPNKLPIDHAKRHLIQQSQHQLCNKNVDIQDTLNYSATNGSSEGNFTAESSCFKLRA